MAKKKGNPFAKAAGAKAGAKAAVKGKVAKEAVKGAAKEAAATPFFNKGGSAKGK